MYTETICYVHTHKSANLLDGDSHVELHVGTCCLAIRNSMNDCGDGPALSCEARGPSMGARYQQNTGEWKRSLLDGSDRAPEEACEFDVPASNVAVVEGNMQLGIQLGCLQQADVGRQNCGSDVAPVASDGCCVYGTHTQISAAIPFDRGCSLGACARAESLGSNSSFRICALGACWEAEV